MGEIKQKHREKRRLRTKRAEVIKEDLRACGIDWETVRVGEGDGGKIQGVPVLTYCETNIRITKSVNASLRGFQLKRFSDVDVLIAFIKVS